MRALLALSLLLPGCLPDSLDSVTWDVGVRPVSADPHDYLWADRVDTAVRRWSVLIADAGCDAAPFDGSQGHRPVFLVDRPTMDAETGTGHVGMTWADRIWIRGTDLDLGSYTDYGSAVLMHELGHALGLEHVSVAEDQFSIMHPSSDFVVGPDRTDVRHVLDLLGCR